MSVTSQIKNKRGPLWEFFERYASTTGINSIKLKLRTSSVPARPSYSGSYLYSITGTAFAYAAHILLPKNRIHEDSVGFNLRRTMPFELTDHSKYSVYWDYKTLIDGLLAKASSLISTKKNVRTVLEASIIFAVLEISARGYCLPEKLITRYRKCDSINDCIDAFMTKDIESEKLINDLCMLTKCFLRSNKPAIDIFKGSKYYHFDKELLHSLAVGGAGIDFTTVKGKNISIIDYKTVLKPIDKNVVMQLLSYALLWNKRFDGDKMNLSSIGIYYPRVSELKTITLKTAIEIAFPKMINLKETKNNMILSFLSFAKRKDLGNEVRGISSLENILGR